jgi:hypothetical protein
VGSEAAGLEHVVVGRAPAPQPGRRHLPGGRLSSWWWIRRTSAAIRSLGGPAGHPSLPRPSRRVASVRGGVWRLATDWADYAEQMVRELDAGPGRVVDRWAARPVTTFERKGTAAGCGIADRAQRGSGRVSRSRRC